MKTLTIVIAPIAAVLLSACASAPYLDSHLGESVNMAKAQQTVNLDASQNKNPVFGIDGQTAKNTIDRYHSASKEPPASTNIFNIGIGNQ
jgi:uncharacterized protein YcfL